MMVGPYPWNTVERYELGGKSHTVQPFAQLFPLMQGVAFELFVEDVRVNGLHRPIRVSERNPHEIWDGRNRARAWELLGANVPPPIEKVAADADPIKVILTENLHRRQMTGGQLAIMGAQIRLGWPLGDAAAVDSPATSAANGGGDEVGVWPPGAKGPRPTQEAVAAQLGISVAYLRRAECVLEVAPDLAKEVLSGSLQLNDAHTICQRMLKSGNGVGQRLATASGDSTDRTGQRPKSPRLSRRRAARTTAPASRGKDPQAGKAPSTDGADLPHHTTAGPSGDTSPQPAPPVAAAEATLETAEAGAAPEPMTPSLLLAGLRLTLGPIDLDPCSSVVAQDRIAASDWFSAQQDGLNRDWQGTVHVFPPLERVEDFAKKLIAEMHAGRVQRASFVGPADLGSGWALQLLECPAFEALVIQRGRRSSETAAGRDRDTGALALFLLGRLRVDASGVHKAFGPWGVPLSPTRPDRKSGGKATTTRAPAGDSGPQIERPAMSTAMPSATRTPKSVGTGVGRSVGVDAGATSGATGTRAPRTEQRAAPATRPEASLRGIADGIGAVARAGRNKISSAEAGVDEARESRFGRRVRKLLGVFNTAARATEPSGPSRKVDGTRGGTGSPSRND